MTHEAQRIAIAEACGWAIKQAGAQFWYADKDGCLITSDITNDLNAMHEAEKTLSTYKAKLNYAVKVNDCVPEASLFSGGDDYDDLAEEAFYLVHAPAAQRAEAFLRTLNLWKD
jgi:hypothetical protein